MLCPPSQKPGGLGGSAPQPKPKNFRKNAKIYVYTFICLCKVQKLLIGQLEKKNQSPGSLLPLLTGADTGAVAYILLDKTAPVDDAY